MTDIYKDFLDDLNLSYHTETFSTKHDTEVLWMPETETLFIRGTDSILDWVFNLLFFPDGETGFHWGFQQKAKDLVKECTERNIIPKTVVGHSAGGAVAQFVGWSFDVDVYSLACPKSVKKVGTAKSILFYDWADKNLVIINQKNDIVGSLPPILLEHPVEPLWLDGDDFFFMAHHLVAFE